MIKESDIIFVTTSMSTKWISHQQKIIKDNFPESTFLVVSGMDKWPTAWFYWIEEVKKSSAKWYIHIDEDCFIENRSEVVRLIQKMEEENIGISAISEAYCHFRGNNPVAFNSFFLVGRVKDLLDINIDFKSVTFSHDGNNWSNSLGIKFKESYLEDFEYVHEKAWPYDNIKSEAEPYYLFCWLMKEKKIKFYYLYPHFDTNLKSTNPMIDVNSKEMAIHMWESRNMDSDKEFYGLTAKQRFDNIKNFLKEKGIV